jgi:hypothetical protein
VSTREFYEDTEMVIGKQQTTVKSSVLYIQRLISLSFVIIKKIMDSQRTAIIHEIE